MITASLFLAASIALGAVAARKIGDENQLVYAIPLSVLFGTWTVFILSLAIGFSETSILASALVLASAAFILNKLWKNTKTNLISQEIAPLFIAALFFFTVFAWVLFHYDAAGNVAGIRTDFGFHHAIISSLANGNFPPENPQFAGHALVYYYFTHLYSASLAVGGMPLQEATWIPQILVNAAVVCLLFLLAKKWMPSSKALPYLAVFLFLFNGSFAFVPWAEKNGLTLENISQILPNPKFYPAFREAFPFENMLTTQMLLSFAIPMAFAIMLICLLSLENKKILAILIGLLPMFHFFAFILLALFLATYVFLFDRKKDWLKPFGIIALLALPQLLFYSQSSAANAIRLRLGWTAASQTLPSIAWFWLGNLGIYLILGCLGWFLIKNKQLRNIAIAALPAVILANVFIFTPYSWDNIKLFFLFFIVLSILAAVALEKIRGISFIGPLLFFVLLVLMTLSGVLSAWTISSHANDVIYPKEDVAMCEQANIRNALFLNDGSQSCLFGLEGNRVFMGFEEWIQYHGYNYSEQMKENNAMLAGDCNLIRKNRIEYVFIGGSAGRNTEANEEFLATKTTLVFDGNAGRIYKTNC
ncbi:MAG: DUF2298 domain-containing protein [Candidatus Micrarchaeota archaeon]